MFEEHGHILYAQGLVDNEVIEDCTMQVRFSLDVLPQLSETRNMEKMISLGS